MSYGMIARADRSGLGNQLSEVARHVPPAKALVVDPAVMRRGEMDLSRYAHVDVRVQEGNEITDDNLRWLAKGMDVVFSVECFYRRAGDGPAYLASCGARTAMSANAELWVGDVVDTLTVPTTWEQHRLPGSVLLPHPVARDVLPPRPHDGGLRVLYHPTAAAMADRNGTQILMQALKRCPTAFHVKVRGGRGQGKRRMGRSTVEWLPPCEHYWDQYPPDADAVVIPRRYGGLSLSMQEAASLGLPVISLDLEPQRAWLPPDALVSPGRSRKIAMKGRGGPFDVWSGEPQALARRLDELAGDPSRVLALHDAALAWAESISWEALRERYRDLLA